MDDHEALPNKVVLMLGINIDNHGFAIRDLGDDLAQDRPVKGIVQEQEEPR